MGFEGYGQNFVQGGFWYDPDNVVYNRFDNLDGVEDKIIYYLISEEGKNEEQLKLVHSIWRLLKYNDEYALIEDEAHPLPSYKEIIKLIDNNGIDQTNKRLFRYPFIEDTFVEQCSQIRVYVDGIYPVNHVISTICFGVEVIIHNKIVNIINNLYDEEGEVNNPTELNPLVTYKNRSVILLKNILALLNGADIAGVGKLIYSQETSPLSQTRIGLWNNRNFFGYKSIFACQMSGVK